MQSLSRIGSVCGLLLLAGSAGLQGAPSLDEAIASKQDLWVEAALAQPDGPSLEFFKPFLPPLHYVNADFRHYPIVLSAPRAGKKSRLVSNGSGINLRANTRAWNEPGTPVLFRVGNDELAYGEFLDRLNGPKLAEGYLPVIELTYHHGSGDYAQETFASVDPVFASNAVSLTGFSFKAGEGDDAKGRMIVRIDTRESLKAEPGRILNERGEVLLWFDGPWKWQPGRRLIEASLTNGSVASVAVAGAPMPGAAPSPFVSGGFKGQRQRCLEAWREILGQGIKIQVPEPYVNDAWRALILGNFSLINGDRMFYSAGNQYEKLYEQEGCLSWPSDTNRSRAVCFCPCWTSPAKDWNSIRPATSSMTSAAFIGKRATRSSCARFGHGGRRRWNCWPTIAHPTTVFFRANNIAAIYRRWFFH